MRKIILVLALGFAISYAGSAIHARAPLPRYKPSVPEDQVTTPKDGDLFVYRDGAFVRYNGAPCGPTGSP